MGRYFEDFTVGLVIALKPYRVTRAEVIDFASQFDPQPIHLDDKAAAKNMLGGLAASGWHTCAMVMRMTCDSLDHISASEGAPGIEEVRWLAPVRPGDTLSGTVTVLAARALQSRPGLGLLRLRFDIFNQAGKQVYMQTNPVFIRAREAAK